jgi:hypothetical protein
MRALVLGRWGRLCRATAYGRCHPSAEVIVTKKQLRARGLAQRCPCPPTPPPPWPPFDPPLHPPPFPLPPLPPGPLR